MKIYSFVQDKLKESKGSWRVVCEKTGLDYSWLTKLAQGRIPNPSVHKIQALADYFQKTSRKKAS